MIKVEPIVDKPGKCEECFRAFGAIAYRVIVAGCDVRLCDGCAVELREVMRDAG